MIINLKNTFKISGLATLLMLSCNTKNNNSKHQLEKPEASEVVTPEVDPEPEIDLNNKKPISEPLVKHIYTADPSAHVFNDKLYIYPSHDIVTDVPMDNEGNHFAMKDYHVLSMDEVGGKVTDHGVALDIKDVPWAGRQMWAPDAAQKGDKFYLYFPVKDKKDVFAIGVASSDSPEGPFKAEDKPIAGTYSMDPSVLQDSDQEYYLYFGGIWGGQLQNWKTGKYDANGVEPKDNEPALKPLVAKLNSDMKSLAETPKQIDLLLKDGTPILAGDHEKRFFEAAWVHKYNGKYYFSYSTGDTHLIAYAIGDNPYGPFTYQGTILNPVVGWTNHHSIAKFKGQWYLFYHDSLLSGETHLRTVKMTPLTHNADGTIQTINAYK